LTRIKDHNEIRDAIAEVARLKWVPQAGRSRRRREPGQRDHMAEKNAKVSPTSGGRAAFSCARFGGGVIGFEAHHHLGVESGRPGSATSVGAEGCPDR